MTDIKGEYNKSRGGQKLQEGQLAVLYPCGLEPSLTALMGKAEDTCYTSSQAITEKKDVFFIGSAASMTLHRIWFD